MVLQAQRIQRTIVIEHPRVLKSLLDMVLELHEKWCFYSPTRTVYRIPQSSDNLLVVCFGADKLYNILVTTVFALWSIVSGTLDLESSSTRVFVDN